MVGELTAVAAHLPRPTSILIVSAHWEQAPLSLSASTAATPLVYDFGGFPQRFYEMTYPTPDASELARRVAGAMPPGDPVHQHQRRGLDHGAWVPLKVLYPAGDIPVLQLSIPTQDSARLLELGERLRPLREEGILIIGSGFLTHGLPFLTEWRTEATPPGWSVEFDRWAADALVRGDVDELASFRSRAPGMPYAHPDRGALHPPADHVGCGPAPRGPRGPADRRLLDGAGEAFFPGELMTASAPPQWLTSQEQSAWRALAAVMGPAPRGRRGQARTARDAHRGRLRGSGWGPGRTASRRVGAANRAAMSRARRCPASGGQQPADVPDSRRKRRA